MEDLHLPMPAFVTLQPRFPFGGLTISRCVDALIRQDLLDPLPYMRRHICGDWGDVRAEHRRYGDPPDIANRRVVTQTLSPSLSRALGHVLAQGFATRLSPGISRQPLFPTTVH